MEILLPTYVFHLEHPKVDPLYVTSLVDYQAKIAEGWYSCPKIAEAAYAEFMEKLKLEEEQRLLEEATKPDENQEKPPEPAPQVYQHQRKQR